jgi:multidrug efflux pump
VDDVLSYRVRAANGEMVPLSAFIAASASVQPNGLATFQQLNSAVLQGVPFPGRTVGEAVAFLQQKANEIMPQGMAYDFKGESRQYVQEGNTLALTFVFALILIYLVRRSSSFRDRSSC